MINIIVWDLWFFVMMISVKMAIQKKQKKIKEVADKNGYKTISMKNDFKTIYGDGGEKIK